MKIKVNNDTVEIYYLNGLKCGYMVKWNDSSYALVKQDSVIETLCSLGFEKKDARRKTEEMKALNSESSIYNVICIPYEHQGRTVINGVPTLNTFRDSLVKPKRGTPFYTLKWLNTMLGEGSREQFLFLTWMSQFVQQCYEYSLKPAPALYLIGDHGSGKSLTQETILAGIVGSGGVGDKLFSTGFTGTVFEKPFIYVSDTPDKVDGFEFTRRVKGLVSRGEQTVNIKYGAMYDIEWKARVIISANLTSDGLQILPVLNECDRDKYLVLYCSNGGRQMTRDEAQLIIDEIPVFANYLLNYTPRECDLDGRFGCKTMVSDRIAEQIEMQSESYDIYVAIQDMICNRECIQGQAHSILADLKEYCFTNSLSDIIPYGAGPKWMSKHLRNITELGFGSYKTVNGKRICIIPRRETR